MSTIAVNRPTVSRRNTEPQTAFMIRNKEWQIANYQFLSETQFKALLIRERKRAERTKNPFLLVVIDVSVLKERGMRNHLMLEKIRQGLQSCSREIDLRGWFRQDREIGMVYADIRRDSVDGIIAKIKGCIVAEFGEHIGCAITIHYEIFPTEDKLGLFHTSLQWSLFYPEIEMSARSMQLQLWLKRAVDFFTSLVALIALSPLLAVIALLIKLSSPGPVLFCQDRVGYHGRRFKLYKFRSMKTDCETSTHKEFVRRFINGEMNSPEKANVAYKMTNDTRITGIGRWLRKTSLDELPQLFNVIKGDMSLVGPRPPIPYEVEAYSVWHYRRLLEAMPGITGLWQIEGRSRTSFDDMVRMDIRYSSSWSFWLDLKLLFKTPAAVFVGKGAY